MQQLTIEHKKITTNNKNQNTEQVEELVIVENKRERKGAHLALSRRVLRILNSDTFYVESESSDNIFYFVKFKPDVFEFCACPDNSRRGQFCKHLYAVIYSIMKGTLKDIDKLPNEVKRYPSTIVTKSYRDEEYDF